jgi:hypothetical protein
MFDQFEELKGCAGEGPETTWDRRTDIRPMATVKSDLNFDSGLTTLALKALRDRQSTERQPNLTQGRRDCNVKRRITDCPLEVLGRMASFVRQLVHKDV